MRRQVLFLLTAGMFLSCEKRTVVTLDAAPPNVTPAPPSACSNGGVLVNGVPVCNGSNGVDGVGIGVLTYASSSCANGGVNIEFYRDFNNNGIKDSLDTVISVSTVCNGLNGLNGQDASVNIGTATISQCPNGGITVNGVPVCNGLNGLDGQNADLVFGTPTSAECPAGGITVNGHPVCNGVNGVSPTLTIGSATSAECPTGGITVNGHPVCNGLEGPPGPSGSNVVAAKLCPADTHPYTEYGFIVGGELYAVLYSNTSTHPHNIGLIRVPPGTYTTTTTGTPKSFTYYKTSTHIVLSCESSTVSYPITSSGGGGSGGSGSLSDASCNIKLLANYGTERHYLTTVSGSGLSGDYKIRYELSNGSFNSESSCLGSGKGFWTNNNCMNSQYSFLPSNEVEFTPIGGSMSYVVYMKGNSSLLVQAATLTKLSTNETMSCVVDNSL